MRKIILILITCLGFISCRPPIKAPEQIKNINSENKYYESIYGGQISKEEFKKQVQGSKKIADIFMKNGLAYLKEENDLENAIVNFRKALNASPLYPFLMNSGEIILCGSMEKPE
ncbi:MAG: hypothetical protein HQL27_08795, partial [Candidatus Omnitrophica bacterium]|nr:hypothetical protein [Candidatus Omnitrophota bacterium]